MCIGIPMKVESLPYPGRAVCSGRGQTENLDVLMLGDVQIGEWVLAWNGMGTKKITEERARQVDAALDALEAAMNGQTPDVEDAFADIVANTGKFPPNFDLYSHPLFLRMVNEHGFESCDKDTFPQFLQKPGLSMVVFIEDPNRMKETMDALVIAPELAKSCGLIEHKAVVGPPNARKLAVTYGFKRWPALVFFRDGKYLGAVDGLRLWADLVREADEIMHSEPHYPPSVDIPVRSI